MDAEQLLSGLQQPWHRRHALLAIPLSLIVLITLVDLLSPQDIHLGPLLVIAPTITVSFAGPRLTAMTGMLAVAAQTLIGLREGALTSRNIVVQLVALALLSSLAVYFSLVRERRTGELKQVRTVSEAAQHVLMWPLPDRIGPLRAASLYLAAEDEAQIGGDQWTDSPPGVLLHHIRHDLLAHAGGRLDDDAALIAIHHAPARQARHAKTTPHDRWAVRPNAAPAKRRMTSPPSVR
ncbi:hypothetical protein [Streptomyces sp. NBC_00316]|uniref:hypothetical protein n=1 Tax=Streptomyces sp. NBC_00316 TaxID=2975710 RepID=UPI002E2CE5E4|nr:hypothetical protein [Streptomyces sp. NBC_00316]